MYAVDLCVMLIFLLQNWDHVNLQSENCIAEQKHFTMHDFKSVRFGCSDYALNNVTDADGY
jgi:hypothetical protein